MSGDIETNPGPAMDKTLNICHWNLNGIASNNFMKLSLLQAQNSIHDFDIICLSETFLNTDIPSDDPSLKIEGYEFLRCDHPLNTRKGGVCIYYKDYLSLKQRVELSNIQECVVCEIIVGSSRCFLSCVYRSPNQTAEQLHEFCTNFEDLCSNICLESPVYHMP